MRASSAPSKNDVSEALARSRAKAGSGRGRMGSLASNEVKVREVSVRGRPVRFVREERCDIPVPPDVREEVRNLFLKVNIAYELDDLGEISETKPLGHVLVIAMQKTSKAARAIVGMPGTNAETKRWRKLGYTHVAIAFLPEGCRDQVGPKPEGYDERAFAARFYKPAPGVRHDDEKGGELVHEIVDELSVLNWIYENRLETLLDVQALADNGLLPKTDEQRDAENVEAMKRQEMVTPHPPPFFSAPRQRTRYQRLFLTNVGESDADGRARALAHADEAFAASVIGKKLAARG